MHQQIVLPVLAVLSSSTMAGIIYPESSVYEVLPGSQVRVLWIVDDISTPLFGYSLDLNLVSTGMGSVMANELDTNFFESRNLITAGGGQLDPNFTVINSGGLGGLFLSTNTADFSTVLPVTGVNDVLAEVVFDVGLDAEGDFVFDLGTGTALSDADGFSVDFLQESLTIRVVPTPASWGPLVALGLVSGRRRK